MAFLDEAELRGLMIAGLAGDSAAYRALLGRCAPILRSYFRRRLPAGSATVEDLVQETLMSVHAKRASYLQALPFTPWLFAIARHRLIDFFRREGRRARIMFAEMLDEPAEPAAEAVLARVDVEALLGELSPKQEKALRLTRLDGLSGEEAAALSGQSPAAIKVNAHRGLRRLMTIVRNDGEAGR